MVYLTDFEPERGNVFLSLIPIKASAKKIVDPAQHQHKWLCNANAENICATIIITSKFCMPHWRETLRGISGLFMKMKLEYEIESSFLPRCRWADDEVQESPRRFGADDYDDGDGGRQRQRRVVW